jgi:membrane protease YdiL (CAAX protease family)
LTTEPGNILPLLPLSESGPFVESIGWRVVERRIDDIVARVANVQFVAAISLFFVAIAETLVTYGDPRLGIAMHIAFFVAALMLAATTYDDRRRAFYLALCIAPIIRIASTGMPLTSFSQPWWYVMTSVPLYVGGFLIARESGLRPSQIYLRLTSVRMAPIELAVWASGIALGYTEWRILSPGPMVDGNSEAWLIGGAFILLICTGLVEEFLFRGVVQCIAVRFLGSRGGIIFSAALFAALHIGHSSLYDDVFVFAVGLYFSVVVRYTRSLLGVTLAHGTINTMLFIILPLGLLPR